MRFVSPNRTNFFFAYYYRIFFAIFAAELNKACIAMIIGREKEQRELLGLLDKEESQFCAVYGRRRVSKTYLIRETFFPFQVAVAA